MSALLKSLAAAAVLSLSAGSQAADIAAGQAKADQVCAACHGKDGNTPVDPSYPRLAGQYKDYLERVLLDYRAENRKNAIMVGQAKALSRADVSNIAAYYASLPGTLTSKR